MPFTANMFPIRNRMGAKSASTSSGFDPGQVSDISTPGEATACGNAAPSHSAADATVPSTTPIDAAGSDDAAVGEGVVGAILIVPLNASGDASGTDGSSGSSDAPVLPSGDEAGYVPGRLTAPSS